MAPSLTPFELVSDNLRAIGALSLAQFVAAGPKELEKPDITPELARNSPVPSTSNTPPPPPSVDNIARLHHECQRAFGHATALKFEFVEEDVDKKQCILTITRPDGTARSYQSEPIFRRRTEAKAQVATVAVDHGALHFITHGESDVLKAKKGLLLVPLKEKQPVPSSSAQFIPEKGTPMPRYKEIESCCKEWRWSAVYPAWFDFSTANKHGAILKIQLAPHSYRVYSCEPEFDGSSQAREHCAELAVREGVLQFIKHGNGQTAPQADQSQPLSTRPLQIPLQLFYDELPRPFEEGFENKTAAEVNSPGWLNTLLANAKGARFVTIFYFVLVTSDTLPPRLLHGCLLKLQRPEECRCYFVEPQFGSHSDAKAGVCLLAMSQGVGRYIREVTAAVEARVTPQMRTFVQNTLLPSLSSEVQRACGHGPTIQSPSIQGAFGATITVAFKPNESASEQREYSVPAQYRSKADARTAVVYHAAEQGVFEFIRFEGQPAPPGTAPAFSVGEDGVPQLTRVKKRKKEKGEGEGPSAKKQKKAPSLQMPAGALALPAKPVVYPEYLRGARVIQAPRFSTTGSLRPHSPDDSLEDGEVLE